MTLISRLMAVFPAFTMSLWLACILWFGAAPGPIPVVALLAAIYLWPLACFRLHHRVYGLKEGASHLAGDDYSPWWGSHQIQLVYIAFPSIEMALRMVPGLFSFWLRLWGSKIGSNVYWTPQIEVVDRGLVEIGDNVVVGHRVGFYSHLIKPTKKNVLLYVKRIKIGDGAFIGGFTGFTPGVEIAPGAVVPMDTRLQPRERYGFDEPEPETKT